MRTVAILAAMLVLAGAVLTVIKGAPGGAAPGASIGPSGGFATAPGSPGPPVASVPPAPSPLPSGYTFYDDFDGPGLSPVWQQHFNFEGIENTWSSSQAVVEDGLLAITASRAGDGWVSQLLDTKTTWTQQYGTFEARIKVPRGRGLWPAFWSYRAGGGEAEIDTMEICANPIGANRGNDVTLLHNAVRWARGQSGDETRTDDLSLDFHVYGVDWRADHLAFLLDGDEVWRIEDPDAIPSVLLPLIVNLAVGGDWCGPSDASTPDGAVLLVDWIRARP